MKESKTICSPAQTSVSLPRKPHATLHVIVAGRGGDILTVQLRFGMTAPMWALISRVVSTVCAKKASNITFDDEDSWNRAIEQVQDVSHQDQGPSVNSPDKARVMLSSPATLTIKKQLQLTKLKEIHNAE